MAGLAADCIRVVFRILYNHFSHAIIDRKLASFAGEDFMEIQAERVCLRKIELSDGQALLEAMDCPKIHQMHSYGFTDIEHVESYIRVLLKEYEAGKYRTLAVAGKESNRLTGLMTIDILSIFSRAEISYWIRQQDWNRGYATESVKAVVKYGFENLTLNRIQALTSNPVSERVLEKSGMTCEGTLRQYVGMKGVYWDCKMYSILRSDYDRQAGVQPVNGEE